MKLPPDHVPGVGVVRNGAMGGLGQKLLEKMGWSVGEGLGKRRDGMREAIRIQEKHNCHGLGLKKGEDWDARRWTEIYEQSLQNVNQYGGKSDSDSSESEDEVMSDERRENPDGTSSTAGSKELKIYEQLRRTSKLGRWSSRNGKLDRIRKQEHLLRSTSEDTKPPKRRLQKKPKIAKSAKGKKTRKSCHIKDVSKGDCSNKRPKSKAKKKRLELQEC